ncbi:MAG: hypothetical protein KJ061_11200 [Vicinamibacteraceae bacterium]|nr:hypothetical protein [Vicinamibacteraceae bacterium]
MADISHAVEHSIVHGDFHGGRVLVCSADEADEVAAEFSRLFPHDIVLKAPMGCGHVCVYTHGAPASIVADHIALHLKEVEHKTLSY